MGGLGSPPIFNRQLGGGSSQKQKLAPMGAAVAARATSAAGTEQAEVDSKFEKWVVQNRMGDIRAKLIELGVADYSDLAELDLGEIRELRAGLKKVAQRKFDKDLKRMGIPTEEVPALRASRKPSDHSLLAAQREANTFSSSSLSSAAEAKSVSPSMRPGRPMVRGDGLAVVHAAGADAKALAQEAFSHSHQDQDGVDDV